jgi:hypothetical protein
MTLRRVEPQASWARFVTSRAVSSISRASRGGPGWIAPGILEALIPGRMQSHACIAEGPR